MAWNWVLWLMAFEKGGEMAWSLSINNIVIDWLDPPLVEVVICCIVVDWGHEGHYVNVIILLYYYTHMRLDVKSYVKLYVKVWCEWVYVILWWSYYGLFCILSWNGIIMWCLWFSCFHDQIMKVDIYMYVVGGLIYMYFEIGWT